MTRIFAPRREETLFRYFLATHDAFFYELLIYFFFIFISHIFTRQYYVTQKSWLRRDLSDVKVDFYREESSTSTWEWRGNDKNSETSTDGERKFGSGRSVFSQSLMFSWIFERHWIVSSNLDLWPTTVKKWLKEVKFRGEGVISVRTLRFSRASCYRFKTLQTKRIILLILTITLNDYASYY